MNGEELEKVEPKIRDPKTEEEKDLVKKAEIRRKMQNEPEKVGRTTQGYKDFVKQQEEIGKQKQAEPILNINFNAKEQKYEIININSDKKEGIAMTIEEIQNDRNFRDFNFEFDKETNSNADIYLAFLLYKIDKVLETKRLENYINATNEKEGLSDKTHINYVMNGIYGKQYSLPLSEEMMKIANYHSDKGLATVEKNKWTQILEKNKWLRKGIDNVRKITNKVKSLVSKNEYKPLGLPGKLTEDEKALKEAGQNRPRVSREKYNEYIKNKEEKMKEEGKQVIHASTPFRESIKASDEVIKNIQKIQEEKKNKSKTSEDKDIIAKNKAKETKPLEGEEIKFEDWSK